MKKVLVFVVLSLIVLSSSAFAENRNYVVASVEKAKEGFTNILTGWLEVPYQIGKGYKDGFGEKEKNKVLGGFFGIFRGVIHGVGRTAAGAYQVATFPLPEPKNNEGIGIPLDSKYVWEEGKQYSIANQGLEPIGKKAVRGTINAAFGILDMPAQINKGFGEGKPFVGIGKAIVFPIGRIASGIYDIVTVLLPNETENYGYTLEEKQPWDGFMKEKQNNGL